MNKRKFYNLINKKDNDEPAELYIEGEIVDEGWEKEFLESWFGARATASSEFSEQLKALNGKPLKIHCNSVGGSFFAGTAMYCALLDYKGEKTGYIDSLCASAATFPMLACDKTYMTSASGYCAHLPMTSIEAFGNKNDIKEAYEETIKILDEIESVIVDAYKRKTGLSAERIRNILNKDEVMSASKTIELGFVDGYVEDEPKYDKSFIENIFRRNVMVYNSLKPKYRLKNEEEAKAEQFSVTIENKPETLNLGDTGIFAAKVVGITDGIVWTTSDESIISITESGEYEALAVGEATITVTAGEYSDSMTIEVIAEEKEEEKPEEPNEQQEETENLKFVNEVAKFMYYQFNSNSKS